MFAFIFFGYDVGTRIVEYFKYETTVTLNLEYKQEVPYPAISVCNINAFRLVQKGGDLSLRTSLIFFSPLSHRFFPGTQWISTQPSLPSNYDIRAKRKSIGVNA